MKKTIHQGKMILALLLCAVMAAGLLPGTTGAAKAITSGPYEYKVNADGITVTITKYTGTGGYETIPETLDDKPVTGIDKLGISLPDMLDFRNQKRDVYTTLL